MFSVPTPARLPDPSSVTALFWTILPVVPLNRAKAVLVADPGPVTSPAPAGMQSAPALSKQASLPVALFANRRKLPALGLAGTLIRFKSP